MSPLALAAVSETQALRENEDSCADAQEDDERRSPRFAGARSAVFLSSVLGVALAVLAALPYLRSGGGGSPIAHGDVSLVLQRVAKAATTNDSAKCAADYNEDCRHSPCCNEFTTCYEKDHLFASCKPACAFGAPDTAPPWNPDATQEPWSCKVLGETQKKPEWDPPEKAPSMFCFLLTQVMGAEPELLRRQLTIGSSIFGCNAFSIFSERKMVVGVGPDGPVITTAVGGPMSTASKNTDEFLRVWSKVHDQGVYKKHDWTVKVDPDTMFIPSKLRPKLVAHNVAVSYDSVYFKNCAAYTSVQGPLEIFSLAAGTTFFAGLKQCQAQDYITSKGEDWFFEKCMDSLGVRAVFDSELLDDSYCGTRTDDLACDNGMAAFHPLKTVKGYMKCYEGSK